MALRTRSTHLTRLAGATLAAAVVLSIPAQAGAAPAPVTPSAPAAQQEAKPTVRPLVVGHRGASGYRPEHTLAAYELAARQGADYIEPDLVITRDGVLVARHENLITDTTDVAERPEFADRRTTKMVDGSALAGWFVEDFTLAELKTLRAKERLPLERPGSTQYDGMFQVPTFEEVLQLRERLSQELGREIGVYPETKHPTYFDQLGLSLEEPLVALLEEYGLNRPNSPVYVQSFELENLEDLNRNLRLRAPSVFLSSASGSPYDSVAAGDELRDYAYYTTDAGLKELKKARVDGLGPALVQVVSRNADGSTGEDTGFVEDAHRFGFDVHPYTFRAENKYLYTDFRVGTDPYAHGDLEGMIQVFLDTGIDGFFTDHPDLGVAAVEEWMADRKEHPGRGQGVR